MAEPLEHRAFRDINRGYASTFGPGRLSLGLVVPIEAYPRTRAPTLVRQVERIQLAESLGFAAAWLRDVPFDVPTFGDTGQIYDPMVYLGLLAGQTSRIALGVASLVLPLRHPAHVAKAAASVDALSGGRLLLGIASGDRPEEYPALNLGFSDRGARFRASVDYIRRVAEDRPAFDNPYGAPGGGIDLLPKPVGGRLPLLVTGGSQQHPDWIASHGDGWMIYPRSLAAQATVLDDWRSRVRAAGGPAKPVMQPLYVDLADEPDAPPQPIHLGLRLGTRSLRSHLRELEAIGVNHVALNLRFDHGDVEDTLRRIASDVLPDFPCT